jgi:hypothetical protein
VLRWYFGDAPILARVSIDAPKNEDRTILANLVGELVGLGAQVPQSRSRSGSTCRWRATQRSSCS